MRARLQRDDHSRGARAVARRLQRDDFGVGAAEFGVPAFADDASFPEHDRADHGVRRDAPPTPPREVEGALHRLRFGDALRS